MEEKPSTVMGCVKRPLIDLFPIENFIMSILHIIIGVGNSLLDVFYEWIEWRVKKLTQQEVVHRNTVVYMEIKANQEKEAFQKWLKNEGSCLRTKFSIKKTIEGILC